MGLQLSPELIAYLTSYDFVSRLVVVLCIVVPYKLWLFLLRLLFYFCTLVFETQVLKPIQYLHHFPRNPKELVNNKSTFFSFLKRHHVVPRGAQLLGIKQLGTITTEPKKNATSIGVGIHFTLPPHSPLPPTSSGHNPLEHNTMRVFVKFQTGQNMPLYIQTLRAAAEPGLAREVDFYNHLSFGKKGKSVRVFTPRCVVGCKISRYNLVCIVLEFFPVQSKLSWEVGRVTLVQCKNASKHIPEHQTTQHPTTDANSSESNTIPPNPTEYIVIPDHQFDNVVLIQCLLKEAAVLNAQFLGKTKSSSVLSWMPKTKGIGFCEWIRTLGLQKEPVQLLNLYKSIEKYFKKHPLALCHGDCRPGNMIFGLRRDQNESQQHATEVRVIFADWEAVNMSPVFWDFVYCTTLGLPNCSTKNTLVESLFDVYHNSLLNSVDENQRVFLRTKQQYLDDCVVLTVLLGFLSRSVVKIQAWDNQGNTRKDREVWRKRVHESLRHVDKNRLQRLLKVDEKTFDVAWTALF